MLVKIGEVAKLLNVSTQTIREWTKQGKLVAHLSGTGTRYYDLDNLYETPPKGEQSQLRKVFYCRVSSRKQTKDLERQVAKAQEEYPNHEIIKDIGSGLNWNRLGLRKLIKEALSKQIGEIVVFHRDRLCRFGFEILEFMFTQCGIRFMVLDKEEHKSKDEEFAENVIEIMHHFSCQHYGKRKYIKQGDRGHEIENSEDEQE